ncbi:unnamed protein product [Acanthoscelides obtectus]|uniref:Uncharacterized protein n=1 Tax=Acanthoscelides obtectus TaxID=200917 RepID=A0A9P0P835_ACAOB|nr:unnamed protein product [Acanthoscelides obtectus]CAK1664834.1 hypothetical protein AOBTE_LOCUS24496 [Acanthoscelides obtectus]
MTLLHFSPIITSCKEYDELPVVLCKYYTALTILTSLY